MCVCVCVCVSVLVLHSQSEREEFETDSKQKYERERVLLTEENKKLASELDKVKTPFHSLSLSLFLSISRFFSLFFSFHLCVIHVHSFMGNIVCTCAHNIHTHAHRHARASTQCVKGDVDIYM